MALGERLRVDSAQLGAGQQREHVAEGGADPGVRPVDGDHAVRGQQQVERVEVAVQQGLSGDLRP
jgi:hypothetical protein